MGQLEDIYHWRSVDAQITTSGQPSESQLKALSDAGVEFVINLGLHEHERALPDERASATKLGMTYVHIPVAFDAPSETDFDAFCNALDQIGSRKAHLHCIANFRVTAFLYRYWRDVRGWSDSDARALMDSVWQPGGVWADFIGDHKSVDLPHRGPV